MKISKELIEAFFLQQCTPEEAQQVSEYLKRNPQEADKFLPIEDWQEPTVKSLLPDEFWNRQWEVIQAGKNKGRVALMIKRLAVAAVFLIAIGASVFFFTQRNPLPQAATADVTTDFNTEENKTHSAQRANLSDGTVVELMPGATITYKSGFEKASRDIVLKGEATFRVAKDTERPFTVYSGTISTTALGTKFKVVYKGSGTKTQVYLYEGKVLVKAANATNKKESYLVAGDVFSYADNIAKVTRVNDQRNIEPDQAIAADINQAKSRRDAATTSAKTIEGTKNILIPNWYKFEKESLSNVFDQLAGLYDVKIEYDHARLEHKYFIGKFEKEKTIDHILKTIAELNHLQVEKIDERHFIIK